MREDEDFNCCFELYGSRKFVHHCQQRTSSPNLDIDSNAFNAKDNSVPVVNTEVVEYGDELGKGGFCTVYAIKNITENKETREDEDSITREDNVVLKRTIRRLSNESHSYAIKVLRPDLNDSVKVCSKEDMENEVKLLSMLSHKNIVSVYLTSSFHDNVERDYFLVLDRVDITFDRLIIKWRRLEYVEKQRWNHDKSKLSTRLSKQLIHRMKCCHEILSGLAYLHEKNIIYRDLKPENIGMDPQGIIKIFDFGLAKELKDTYKVRDDQYQLSVAGTRRYMSPEVFLGELYGKPADIYSFALLMWQCVSLRLPYADLKVSNFTKKVMIQKKRPKLLRKLDSDITRLISLSWSHDPALRPTTVALYDELGVYISQREIREGEPH